jgi:hypothetical protein
MDDHASNGDRNVSAATPTRGPIQDLVGSLVGRLKYPWVFALLAVLFVADLVVPDPIPFLDELMLALLTFLVGSWRTRRKAGSEAVETSAAVSKEGKTPPEPRA